MEKDVRERMQLILKEFKSNCTKLANMFDVNQKTLNSQINQSTSISLSTILLILEAFPTVSAEWLLRGSGEMTKGMGVSSDSFSAKDAELVALSRDLVNVIGKIMDLNR